MEKFFQSQAQTKFPFCLLSHYVQLDCVKEIDFKLQTSTPFFDIEMAKALVNTFIHFAICQTEKSGLGTQAELLTSVGKKGWDAQRETKVPFIPVL